MIDDPPFDDGAFHVTVACVLPAVADTLVGVPGVVGGGAGVTAVDAFDDAPSPTELVAETVNVKEVPLTSVVKVAVRVWPLTVTIWPPGLAVTVYAVIVDPPVDAGALQVTVACVLPAVAVRLVGAPGTVIGVTALEATEAALVPTLLVAVTVKV